MPCLLSFVTQPKDTGHITILHHIRHAAGDANFEHAKFNGNAFFENGNFGEYAAFFGVEFGRDAYFENANFDADAEFWDAGFGGIADFKYAKFNKNTKFSEAIFSNKTEFCEAVFSGYAGFGMANFVEDADFKHAKFNLRAYFGDAQFDGIADFYKSKFNGTANFNNATFDKGLDVSGIEFNIPNLRLELDSVNCLICDDDVTYQKLIKNFKELGQFQDANDCYYQYQEWSQGKISMGTSKFVAFVSWASCGYGVRLSHTIYSSIFIVLFFGLIYYYKHCLMEYTCPCLISTKRCTSFMDAFHFSLLTFTLQAHSNLRPIGRYKYLVMAEGISGLILFGLFVVTLCNIMTHIPD